MATTSTSTPPASALVFYPAGGCNVPNDVWEGHVILKLDVKSAVHLAQVNKFFLGLVFPLLSGHTYPELPPLLIRAKRFHKKVVQISGVEDHWKQSLWGMGMIYAQNTRGGTFFYDCNTETLLISSRPKTL